MNQSLRAAWITEDGEFASLRSAWNGIADRAAGGNPFLRHEWFDAAWQWSQGEARLRILAAWRGDRLAGVLPLTLREEWRGRLPARTLGFLAVPDTQLCDMLCDPDEADACGRLWAAALKDRAGEWDALELSCLPEDSAVARRLLPALTGLRFDSGLGEYDRNPYIDLEEGYSAYYGRRTRSLKKANSLSVNRLKRIGEVDMHWTRVPGSESEPVESLLEDFIGISSRSWKQSTGLSLDRPGPNAFIRAITRHAVEQGWLSMWHLTLDGRPVAMEYQLAHDGRVWALRADIDQACEAQGVSPGSYLNWKLIEALFGAGLRRYYMGPGNNAYKRRWTEQGEPLYRLTAYSPSMRGKAIAFAERRLLPAARRVRDALRRPRQERAPEPAKAAEDTEQ